MTLVQLHAAWAILLCQALGSWIYEAILVRWPAFSLGALIVSGLASKTQPKNPKHEKSHLKVFLCNSFFIVNHLFNQLNLTMNILRHIFLLHFSVDDSFHQSMWDSLLHFFCFLRHIFLLHFPVDDSFRQSMWDSLSEQLDRCCWIYRKCVESIHCD